MPRLIVSVLLLFTCFFCSAKTVIKVVDQFNQPLADAVINFELKNTLTQPTVVSLLYVMDQVEKAFLPHVLVVPKGAKVSFPNSDDIRHHVYSDLNMNALATIET